MYHKKMNNLLIVGTPVIDVPDEMIYFPKKGKERIIHTLTKTGAITKRNKKPVIRLTDNGKNEINITDTGMSQKINKLYHSSALHSGLRNHFQNKHDDILKDISKLNPKLKKDKLLIETLTIKHDKLKDINNKLINKSHSLFTKTLNRPMAKGSRANTLYNSINGYVRD